MTRLTPRIHPLVRSFLAARPGRWVRRDFLSGGARRSTCCSRRSSPPTWPASATSWTPPGCGTGSATRTRRTRGARSSAPRWPRASASTWPRPVSCAARSPRVSRPAGSRRPARRGGTSWAPWPAPGSPSTWTTCGSSAASSGSPARPASGCRSWSGCAGSAPGGRAASGCRWPASRRSPSWYARPATRSTSSACPSTWIPASWATGCGRPTSACGCPNRPGRPGSARGSWTWAAASARPSPTPRKGSSGTARPSGAVWPGTAGR